MNSVSFIRVVAPWLALVVTAVGASAQTVSGSFSSGMSQYSSSGGSASFSVSLDYSGMTLSSLGVSVSLPAGWSYVSAGGSNPPSIPPSEGTTESAEFAYITAPANSASFSFTLNYPAGLTGDQTFSATAYYKSNAPGATQQTLSLSTVVIAEPPPTPVAPTFSTQPSSQTVTAGGNVSFTAAASGTPAPTLQWRKNGTNVSGATGTTLTLNSVQASDAGSYDVVATNSAGSATSSAATLTVNTAPAITSQPGDVTVNQGQNASFSVSASGSPAPEFQWRKEGVDIGGATSATLTLNSVTTAQAGSYTVVVSNSIGSTTSNAATLTVNTAPAFTGQPSNQTVTAGATATFSASASGTPAPSLQWRRNGVALSGATGTTLTLNNVQTEQAGSYDVVATNSAGSATSSAATLTVNTAPAITSQPGNVTVNQGQNASFSVSASGSPAPEFQWRKDGVNIGGATSATLTLNSVTTAQAGSYTVVVSNSIGSTTSAAATLTVNVPPSFTSQPSSQTVAAGANVTFSVDASGSPAPALQWRRNGVAIAGATSATLTLNGVVATQAGTYDAVATNSAGSTTSAAANLTVQFGPSITSQPVNRSVSVGASVSFSVTAEGVPSPTYQWRKDGVNISGNATATTATLTLGSVELAHAGSYDVIVSNALGIASSNTATLTVNVAPDPDPDVTPIFTAHPADVMARVGESIVLRASASGVPAPSYQWQKDGVNVDGAVQASLTLSPLEVADAGSYTLVATNAAGTARSETAVVGIATTQKVEGAGSEVGVDIVHPNRNVYDQILLTGASAVITADAGQVTRISCIDMNDDIVQIEFSGAGTLTVALEGASGPATPRNYNQGVTYMKGQARITITGANETTHVSVFSVGRINAVNQTLFRDEVDYDGFADLASITISSANGKFGGLRTANAGYSGVQGTVGVFAPGVEFTGPVLVGDMSAFDSARPMLVLGSAADVRVAGGDLFQANGRAIAVSGIGELRFVDGSSSHGAILPAQSNRGRFEENGVDVTAQIRVGP